MSDQPALFYESYEDALLDDVKALGGTKVVGKWFFPEKDTVLAGKALGDRLNPNRRDRLGDEQERLIMRRARETRGFSAALFYLCDDTGFDRPLAKNPEDEKAKLQRQVVDAARTLRECTDRLERLAHAPLQAINGGRTGT